MSILDKKTDAKKKKFLSKIPGFRSNNPLLKTVASIYYIVMLISLVAVSGEGYLTLFVLSWMVSPFVVAGIIDAIKNRKYVNGKYLVRKVVAPFVVMIVLLSSSLSVPVYDAPDIVQDETSQVSDKHSGHSEEVSNTDINALETVPTEDSTQSQEGVDADNNMASNQTVEAKEAEIHFIDTGNSDAILIKQGDQAALIDGGDNDDEGRVVSYLQSQGVTQLEYVFATHPHADHIGGLDAVVDAIPIKNIYISNGDMDTKTYADFMTSMVNKGLSPSVPLLNSEFQLGTSTFKVLSVADGNDPNNNSIVLLYTNGEDKVLLMGDAEAEIESQINPGDIDLLKVGHHGSHSSSTSSFINKISPEYAVILVGENNKYGHPHTETMTTLKSHNIEIHRTDECGNIVFKSTGNGLVVECKEGSYQSGNATSSSTSSSSGSGASSSSSSSSGSGTSSSSSSSSGSGTSSSTSSSSGSSSSGNIVYANGGSSKSNKYHSSANAHNMEGAIKMTEAEAKANGYVACKKCY